MNNGTEKSNTCIHRRTPVNLFLWYTECTWSLYFKFFTSGTETFFCGGCPLVENNIFKPQARYALSYFLVFVKSPCHAPSIIATLGTTVLHYLWLCLRFSFSQLTFLRLSFGHFVWVSLEEAWEPKVLMKGFINIIMITSYKVIVQIWALYMQYQVPWKQRYSHS